MGLFIRQEDNRSELQRRLAAELTEKAKKRAELENQPRPDGVSDSTYIKDTKTTGKFAGLWILLIIAAVVGMFIFMFMVD